MELGHRLTLNLVLQETISALFILVLTVIIDPGITTNYIDSRIELLNENQETLIESINEQAYVDALEGVKDTTPLDLAFDDFLKKNYHWPVFNDNNCCNFTKITH